MLAGKRYFDKNILGICSNFCHMCFVVRHITPRWRLCSNGWKNNKTVGLHTEIIFFYFANHPSRTPPWKYFWPGCENRMWNRLLFDLFVQSWLRSDGQSSTIELFVGHASAIFAKIFHDKQEQGTDRQRCSRKNKRLGIRSRNIKN